MICNFRWDAAGEHHYCGEMEPHFVHRCALCELPNAPLARYAVLTGEDVEPRDEDERTG